MNKFYKILMALFIISCKQLFATESWIDVTDTYIVNPRFDNDDVITGWSGTAFGSYEPIENAEHYSKTYNTYQTITGLIPGKYRLSLNAFYRSGSSSDDYTHYINASESYRYANLYATSSIDNKSTSIAYASGAALKESLGGGVSYVGNGYYIPNNMAAAYYWFEAGYYVNTVEVTVGSDGVLTIGVKKDTYVNTDWTCLDNWKLEYYGELVDVTSISLNKTSFEANIGESVQLTASFLPSNATYQKCTWTSSDESIATVDAGGVVYCVKKGIATITATSIDGTKQTTSCTVTVVNNGATAASMIINEIMIANIDMYVDPSWNYGSWIELYNPTSKSANMAYYWVSDDPDSLKKALLPMKIGSIPANGFMTLWFEHTDTRKDVSENWTNTQVDLELNPDGGAIYISDESGNLIAKQDYPASIMRTSYARKTDGGNIWGYTANPTPTATNSTSKFASEQLAAPIVNKDGELFTGSLSVQVAIPSGAMLIYTTDGTTPTLTNGKISAAGVFSVSETTTYRFRLFQDGFLPSNVVTRSYIYKDKDYYFPIISIVTNPDNLYDNEIGVYVDGTNGKTANQDATKRNFNMDWDRPVNFEYMVNDEAVFNQETDFSISGGWSRKYIPRSFKIKAQKVYGLKDLLYPFFEEKPYNKNKVLLFRNGGNDDYNKSRMKDVSLQEIARQSGFRLNLQSYQPVHVFFNGEYIAMLNMREPSNKHYAYANYAIDTDDIDAFEMSVDSGYVQAAGTNDAFKKWYSLSETASDALTYQQICDIVDIDDYANYMAFKFFLNDWDWPHNNLKAFKGRTDGKFHFMVYDLDNCVTRSGNNIFNDFAGKKRYTFYQRPEYNWTSITAEVEMVTIFLNMIQNEEFKKKFIDTYCLVGGAVFRSETENKAIVNAIVDNISTAIGWEGNSSYLTNHANSLINAISGSFKLNMINMMKNFSGYTTYDGVYYDGFGLSSTETQMVQISSNVANDRITLDGMEIPKSKFDGYIFSPVTLKALAPAGYKFAGWKDTGNTGSVTKDIFSSSSSWSYYDQGSLDNSGWTHEDYSTIGWSTSTAPFGYGNTGKTMASATTKLNWGDDNSNRRTTFYFRKEFYLNSDPTDNDTYILNYNVDDALIAYVNGNEVGTYHLNSGATYSTTSQSINSSWYEGDTPHSGSLTIDNSFLKKGKNVIAVEVHNCTTSSSDAWWDAGLQVNSIDQAEGDGYVSTDSTYMIPSTGSHNIVATYAKISDADFIANHVTSVKINEVSAANSLYMNDNYKRNDWIELYNTTDESVDVAGMYVSDDLSNLKKYQIIANDAVNSIIPAHGFLVLWCDKLTSVSQLHTSFKLAAEGGAILLTAEDGSWTDTLEYCEHIGVQTVGLYPDGGTTTYVMDVPTIAKSNRISTYDDLYIQPHFAKGSEFEFAMGDVNTDSLVNVVDYTALVSMIMETDEDKFNLDFGDFNSNGFADVADLTALVSVILNDGSGLSVKTHKAVEKVSLSTYNLAVSPFGITAGNDYVLAVNMNAFANELTNVQLDLTLPKGISLVDASNGSLATKSHNITISSLNDRSYRLMLSSADNSMLSQSGGELIYVTLKADDNVCRELTSMNLTNIYASRADATLVHFEDIEVNMAIGDATGIDYVSTYQGDNESAKTYDISGRKTVSPAKGMYIKNGKKIWIK